ncbi:MAG TPA: hypothetical protein VF928_15160 [Usitatibacteraceae bacterium]
MSRYFYHSFPRGAGDLSACALSIFESILDRGLLLTPERIEFREELSNDTLSKPLLLMQKRISFTELEPRELPQHALTFGPFSLEWDITTLIQMGAIPVFYVPLKATPGSFDGVASAMLARLAEIQELLVRLEGINTLVNQTLNKAELLNITKNGIPVMQTQCTVGGAQHLLQFLQAEIQPISALTGAIRALSGYFYPIDHEKHTELLGYYRQREWRLLANNVWRGTPLTVPTSESDVKSLRQINDSFFGREVEFPTGSKILASECHLYKTFRGTPVIEAARKLICPKASITAVTSLLNAKRVKLEIVAMEEYAAT